MDPVDGNENEQPSEVGMLYMRLISLGYGQDHARATALAQSFLIEGASQLIRCKQDRSGEDKQKILIAAGSSDLPEEILLHDNVLLPEWRKFADALASVPDSKRGYICLTFWQVQLGKSVSDMLLQSFETAPIQSLELKNVGLESDVMEFLVDALKTSTTLKDLAIIERRIESENDALSLVSTVNDHPTVDTLFLDRCGLGQTNAVMAAIFPALGSLVKVSLDGNYIGSYGAKLISDCLATNPCIETLYLDNNLLNDEDARIFAESLRTNTKLQTLRLAGNHIAQAGINALVIAVLGICGLNEMYDSNHTCRVYIEDQKLSRINLFVDPMLNRKVKIFGGIQSRNASYTNILSLDNVHIGVMPRVLAFVQGGHFDVAEHNGLNEVFLLLREWNMPLLYTSRIGPELQE